MLRKLLIAATLSTSLISFGANAAQEQVWEAVIQNSQRVCGIDYNGSKQVGGILLKNEQGTDNSKAITFQVKTNTPNVKWKITEGKLVEGKEGYSFNENLLTQSTKDNTSLYVNNREYSWSEVQQEQTIQRNEFIKLVPKINMDETELPYGTTKIQGKIQITCSS